MRSNLMLNKILLAALLVLCILCSFVILGISFSIIKADALFAAVDKLQTGVLSVIFWTLVGLAILAGSVWAALVFLFSNGEEGIGHTKKASVMVQEAENGSLYVSLPAVDSMVRRYSRDLEGIRSLSTHVSEEEEGGVSLKLKITVTETASIPSITAALQNGLRSHVEELSGLKVKNVDVLVADKKTPVSVS